MDKVKQGLMLKNADKIRLFHLATPAKDKQVL